jgi:hypothetical protein
MRTRLGPALLALALLLVVITPANAVAQNEISVDLVTATGVEDRQPVGVGVTFPSDVGMVYAWMRVTGASDQAIQVVWSHGSLTFNVPLEIGGSPWRTWTSKTIRPVWTGEWTVDVQDAQGNSITSTSFTIEG